jgi:hypothetical protein
MLQGAVDSVEFQDVDLLGFVLRWPPLPDLVDTAAVIDQNCTETRRRRVSEKDTSRGGLVPRMKSPWVGEDKLQQLAP